MCQHYLLNLFKHIKLKAWRAADKCNFVPPVKPGVPVNKNKTKLKKKVFYFLSAKSMEHNDFLLRIVVAFEFTQSWHGMSLKGGSHTNTFALILYSIHVYPVLYRCSRVLEVPSLYLVGRLRTGNTS